MMILKGFKSIFLGSLLSVLIFFWACTPAPIIRETALKRLKIAEYPTFEDHGGYDQLAGSIEASLSYLRKLPAQRLVDFGPDRYSVGHLIRSLEAFTIIIQDHPAPETLRRIISQHFRVYQAHGNAETGSVLFTGYYEPIVEGRKKPSAEFPTAVHARPSDLVEIDLSRFAPDLNGRRIIGQYTGRTVLPYPDRNGIRRQTDFDRTAPPLAWVRDEIDLFNLMVQGSGRLAMENGEMLQLQYDTSNGHPYRSIGRLLIDQGKISAEQMSMQAIRDYLRRNPQETGAILDYNPRYIFFRSVNKGPLGSLGVALTPLRSIAVDHALFPSAALAFVIVPTPRIDARGNIRQWAPMSRFVLAQDAGSAITGASRVDLFWGHGRDAEVAAGHLKHAGQIYFLVLQPTADNAKEDRIQINSK